MTTSTGNPRRLRFSEDQNNVPIPARVADLVGLAQFIADATSPAQRVELEPEDRLLLMMALPNLPEERTHRLLLDMVAELHTAEMHDRSGDHNQNDADQAEVHRASASQLARDAVEADLEAGAR
jgi:hypothetical protein